MSTEVAERYIDALLVGDGTAARPRYRRMPAPVQVLIPDLLYRCHLLDSVEGSTVTLTLFLRLGDLGGALWEPFAVAILIPVMLAVIWRWRYVSAGSLTGVVLAPVVVAALAAVGWASVAPIGYGIVVAVLVTVSHRDNIARLRAGTERRIGR